MSHPRPLRLSMAAVGAVLATAAATVLPAGPGTADTPTSAATTPDTAHHPQWRMIATGLDNPRQLSFDSRGNLYVAEAGRGGSGPCQSGPERDDVCYGTTGAITRIGRHSHRRVVRHLPSLAAKDGTAAIGPADVAVDGRGHYLLTIGLGADPATRAGLPTLGRRLMGTLAAGRVHGHGPRVVADLAASETAKDPDGEGPDSNPVGFARSGHGVVAADAGGNDLLRIGRHGHITTLAVFPAKMMANPMGGPNVPMDAVPTSVTRGPDGAWYVSQLTGFPFPVGGASIFRVVPGHAPTVFATGLTNVTDLAWHRGRLYAVQLANGGLLTAPQDAPPVGSLVRVPAHSTKPIPVAASLTAPYGLAIRHLVAYVSTCTVCPGGGGVARVPLH